MHFERVLPHIYKADTTTTLSILVNGIEAATIRFLATSIPKTPRVEQTTTTTMELLVPMLV